MKGYASHERETFERVTQARSAAQSATGPAEQAQAEGFLTQALRQLFAVAEAYPELRATENFQNLQNELAETENKIAVSRQIYNDTVLTYNNKVQQIPTNIVAGMTGFQTREFFEAGPEAVEARPSIFRLGRLTRALIVLLLVVAPATSALAKSFWMTAADVDVVVNDDGSLSITERLTYDFDGDFSGAYRDIPLRPGEAITGVSVSDESVTYEPGGCTELGCSSPPGNYGVEEQGDLVRIVWHHSSLNEQRTFQISYVMTGVTVAYDDVVDVNLQVWGDQWAVGLNSLEARMDLPDGAEAGDVLVYGHPYGVDGETSLGSDQVSPSLVATNVPAYQWVEMRTVFPRPLLPSTEGATVVAGNGLESIIAEEDEFASEASDATSAARSGLIWGSVLAVSLSAGLGSLVYFKYGKEPAVD